MHCCQAPLGSLSDEHMDRSVTPDTKSELLCFEVMMSWLPLQQA